MAASCPQEITDRTKQGFSAPDASWFRGESIDYINRLLRDPKALIYDFVQPEYVANVLDQHCSGQSESPAPDLVVPELRVVVQVLPRRRGRKRRSGRLAQARRQMTGRPAGAMRILLTGATGFVGRHLLATLAPQHDVFALARELPDTTPEGVNWIEQDLARPLEGVPGQIDAVVHLAQSRRYREFPEGSGDLFEVNVASTFRLLEYARQAGARSFVHASTGGVYGGGEGPLDEGAPLRVLGFYPASKLSAEALVRGYETVFTTVLLRFFFVYGPGQTGMLVPTLIDKVRSGEELTVQGDEGLRINPIHVEDTIAVFEPALALERSDVFNVSGDETVSIRQLIRVIEDAVGRSASVRTTDETPAEDLIGANQKMKDVLGVTPRISLVEGIRSML